MTVLVGRPKRGRRALGISAALASLLLAACTAMPPTEHAWDPWESFNRQVFAFNDGLDRAVLKPVSEGYLKIVPSGVRTAVSNFFDNLAYINVILNSFLQGKGAQGYSDVGRFIVNTTVGLAGLIDIATPAGIPRNEEDFGQTLAVWGVREGPYLVLPLLGPSTFRDAPGYAFSAFAHPLTYYRGDTAVAASLAAVGMIDQRARAKGAFELINATALDRYVFVREAWRQRRLFLIYDGKPPLPSLDLDAPPLPGEKAPAREANPPPSEPPRPQSQERRQHYQSANQRVAEGYRQQ